MRRFSFPWRSRAAIARDVDAELAFHLDMQVRELTIQGVEAEEARRRARAEFGDLERTRQYCRAVDERTDRAARVVDRLAEVRQDARYGLATLRRNPGFAVVSLLTLALAVGANTAIFSVARAVLLQPLPYGAPGALVALFEGASSRPGDRERLAPANYVDYRAQQHTFADMGAYLSGSATWRPDKDDPTVVAVLDVSPNLFRVLHVSPLLGRTFAPDVDPRSQALQVVVSYEFWQRIACGRIGCHITLDDQSYDVIGVMPRGFTLGQGEALWRPLDLSDEMATPDRARKQHYLQAIGRLRPGVTLEAARTDLRTIGGRLAARYPDANTGRVGVVVPLREAMAGDLPRALLLLQGAAGIVLLIACANLANLTLSRTIGRRRELALRAALGAGRGRLARQVLTESVVLALVGGALGVIVAVVATRTLLALNPNVVPPMFAGGIDPQVLLFSLALSVLTGVAFGLVPALGTVRASVGHVLVVAQVALAVVLLVGAGLLVRSFAELTRVQIGFDPDHVLTARLTLAGARYDSSGTRNQFYDAVLGEIARSSGVVAAGAVMHLPTRGRATTTAHLEGEPVDETHPPELGYVSVQGDYFKALRIPLLAGRTFDQSDTPDGPETVVINDAAARRFFPEGDAVGRRFRIGPDAHSPWMTVVGVVGDVRDEGLDIPAKPMMFANHRRETWGPLSVVIRTSGDPQMAAPVLRAAVHAADPTLAISDVQTLDAIVGSSLAPRRFVLGLASCFAGVALVLAAVGIYGVLAYLVTTRTREFGVRLALGATARSVLLLVVRQGFGWALLGLGLGFGGAVAGGRLLAGALYGVDPLDATTYASIAVGLFIVVGIACLVPAARATRVDPSASMKAD